MANDELRIRVGYVPQLRHDLVKLSEVLVDLGGERGLVVTAAERLNGEPNPRISLLVLSRGQAGGSIVIHREFIRAFILACEQAEAAITETYS